MLFEKQYSRGDYLVYAERARILTEKTFKKEFIDNKDLRGKDWQLDHKLSIRDCFLNEFPPEMAAHVCNLQIVSKAYNLEKGSRSCITCEELINEITEYDSFWYEV